MYINAVLIVQEKS